MIIGNKMPSKLILGYEKGSYSVSGVKSGSTDEKVYDLSQAIGSVQAEPIRKVTRVDLTKIISV